MDSFKYRCVGAILALAGGSLLSCAGERIVDDYPELRAQVVSVAMNQRGTPYVFGGTRPQTGFDCSGLVQYSYQQLGLHIPRNSYEQYRLSTPVYISRLQPGDLVFFRTRGVFVSHVGIYIGDNRFVHAPGEGRPVSVDRMDSPYWLKRLVGGGSIIRRAQLADARFRPAHQSDSTPDNAGFEAQSLIEK